MKFLFTSSTRAVVVCLLLAIVLSGFRCSDDQAKAVATNIDRIAVLVQTTREVRDELFAQGLIDNQDAYKVTLSLVRVNTATKTFKAKAETYARGGSLDPAGKADLRKLADDVAGAVAELVANGTFGIKNEEAQKKINAGVGSIRQLALALIDAVERLKTKKPETQQAGFPLTIVPLLLLALRQIAQFVDRERSRTGKTAEEIYAEAGVQLMANEVALIDDLNKYSPTPTSQP